MKAKVFIGLAVLVIGIAWFIGSAESPAAGVANGENSSGALTLSESRFEFGSIKMADGIVSKEIVVKNEGGEAVAVTNIYTSCMCTAAEFSFAGETFGPFGMPGHARASAAGMVVPPGGEGILRIMFDPAAHGPSGVGRADRTVYLVTNSSETPKVEVKFSALVLP